MSLNKRDWVVPAYVFACLTVAQSSIGPSWGEFGKDFRGERIGARGQAQCSENNKVSSHAPSRGRQKAMKIPRFIARSVG